MIKEKAFSLELVEHYFHINKYEQVIEIFKDGMGEYINNGLAWYILGYSNYSLENYELAEEQMKESLRLGISEEPVLHVLGMIYINTERWQESESALLEVLRINPESADAHASYAYLMKLVGQRKKASLLIKKALEMNPEDGRSLRLHYLIEELGNGKKEQINSIQKYMNSNDSELEKLLHLGHAAQNQNDPKKAMEHYGQAFALNPENKKLLATLEELEIDAHPLLVPNRLAGRLGWGVIWIIGVGLTILLFSLDFNMLGTIWLYTYIAFCIYTYLSVPIVKFLLKRKR